MYIIWASGRKEEESIAIIIIFINSTRGVLESQTF